MRRRWGIPVATLAIVGGSMLAATSAAAASSVAARSGHMTVRSGGPAHLIRPFVAVNGGIRHVTSSNWSGYAAHGGTGAFTSVSASWVEPTGHCGSGSQYSSFWVGLDGYNSNSVEQTGSEVDCIGRTAEYYAWYEMYPAASVTYPNTVRAGDHFTASVTYIGSNQYTLKISDTTQNWTQTTTKSLSGAPRSSAEVIAEAPCCTASGGILPLTNFGTMSFTLHGQRSGHRQRRRPDRDHHDRQ